MGRKSTRLKNIETEQEVQDVQVEPDVLIQPTEKSVELKKKVSFEPYLGRESLSGEEYEPLKDKKGKAIRAGKTKYFVNRSGNTFELIGVYRNGKGIARRHVRTLKPYKRERVKDRDFLRQLVDYKIPGAMVVS